MGITFRPAKRSGVKLMVGLAGPSGCGKTFSALLLAEGIQEVDGGEIFVIDTENRRSEHYADRFKFQIGELHPPFNPERYLEAIEAAYAAGGRNIIVDSGSHMHEGDGGILDMHDEYLDRVAGDDQSKRDRHNMAAWIAPKRELGKVVNRLLQIDAHFIFCFRAQEKIKPIGGRPKSMGIQPIASDRLSYEMTMRLVLPGLKKGVPDLEAEATKLPEPLRPMMLDDARISAGLGRMLAQWARGDAPAAAAAKPAPSVKERPDQVLPSSSQVAPAREAPSDSSSQEGGASQSESQEVSASLKGYHAELTGAPDKDELVARHEGSENFAALTDDEKVIARELYKLHLSRIRGEVGRAAFNERALELLS